ncbi:LamG domain-containing protein [Aureispira anguillae]|uniref:LamG domain-containing protein n=1 Tax=Aureispira anguillae TaxID=2864201 RepID=A0A915YLY5_9BACT|nr:LamG domain-containing protein [Aureispira anguillae]BDS15665.1 LamG domain-containing protein [Aureispira anguillae]
MKKLIISSFLVFMSLTPFAQVPTNGLVAEYLFSNGSYDDTNPNGYGPNNATAPSTVVNTLDRFGNPNSAKDLAGIHAYTTGATHISLGSAAVLKPRAATISIWVNVDQLSTSGWGYAFNPIILATNTLSPGSYMEAYSLYVVMSNRKLLTLTTRPNPRKQTLFYAGSVPDDSWHHYVMAYNDDTLKSYIDGVLIGSQYKGYNSAGTFSNETVRVGSSLNWSNNRALDGAVDDIRIYNRVLSFSEIQSLYTEANPNQPVIYAEPQQELDGGYVQLEDDKLRIKFNQDYAVSGGGETINYKIYKWDRTIYSGSFTASYGINWKELDLSSFNLSNNEHYTIKFEANKGEQYILRFKTKSI